MMSEQINEIAAALAKAQGAMENADLNRVNPHFKSKYADLGAVIDAIRAPLSANGLSVVQTMQMTERGMVLRTVLMHSSGQFISTEYPLPAAAKPHEMGSALTYARRYSLAALICNSAEDDDGNVAQATKPDNTAAPKISQKQLGELVALIDTKETSSEAVCKYFKVSSLADIPAAKLPEIVAAIKSKPDRQYEEAAE